MSRFAHLADKPALPAAQPERASVSPTTALSRVGRKAISAYFPPELSLAMHLCARRHGLSLQALMAEAFDDVLRKYGESPVGG